METEFNPSFPHLYHSDMSTRDILQIRSADNKITVIDNLRYNNNQYDLIQGEYSSRAISTIGNIQRQQLTVDTYSLPQILLGILKKFLFFVIHRTFTLNALTGQFFSHKRSQEANVKKKKHLQRE